MIELIEKLHIEKKFSEIVEFYEFNLNIYEK